MCYSNGNCGCGCGAGSCFSCSDSACCNNSTRSCSCGGVSGCSDMPYYVNPCGWYSVNRVAVLALVSLESDSCGCNSSSSGICC